MIIAVQTRAAAVIPSEQPHEAGVAVPGPVVEVTAPAACTELTKAGEPCKGTPGEDGLCAAHKPKETADDSGAAQAAADPPGQEAGQAEEAHGEEASG